MSPLFKVNWKDIGSAVISAVIVAVLGVIGNATNVFALDWSAIANVAVLTAISSFVKALGTNVDGKFLGMQIK